MSFETANGVDGDVRKFWFLEFLFSSLMMFHGYIDN